MTPLPFDQHIQQSISFFFSVSFKKKKLPLLSPSLDVVYRPADTCVIDIPLLCFHSAAHFYFFLPSDSHF